MRWLIGHPGPHFSVHDLYEGWVEALRGLGEQVFTFNLGDRISFYSAAYIEVPDLVDEQGRPGMRKAMDRDVALYTAAHEILRGAFLCWPDVVLLVSAFWYPPYLLDALRGRGMQVVVPAAGWHGYHGRGRPSRKKPPVGPSSGRTAAQTTLAAPAATGRDSQRKVES